MIELDQDNLKQIIDENKKVVVQYGAAWCGNCRIIKPKIKRLAAERTDVTFVYVDAEKFPGSRQHAQVDNLPTFAAFHDGKLVGQKFGSKMEIVQELIDEVTSH